MQFDKESIVKFLTERGETSAAQQAAKKFPEKVDHEQHAGLLQRFGWTRRTWSRSWGAAN
jgi:hypothetical protein